MTTEPPPIATTGCRCAAVAAAASSCTTGCRCAAVAAAASSCRRSRWACGTTLVTTSRWSASRRSCAEPSTWVSRTSTWPTTTGRPTAAPSATSVDQSRLRHVARALRAGRRLPQIPPGLAGSIAAADGGRLRRHLLQPPLRPRHSAGGDHGRVGQRGASGQGLVCRYLQLLRCAHPRGGPDPARVGHSPADSPAVLLDAQPVDRASPSRPWPRACSPTDT